ncbi:alanine--tRNA ligase, mitochondrial-like isoform X1 [Scylla paramamosain]|uniref:alanine--tRNA ligase, mitochondrial-like isoform X1 n=1 Tax=Scylla paramamosain TaxID=85552 RepID=UPI003082E79F
MMQWGRGLLRVVWGAPVWVVAGRALHWPANKVRSTFLQYFENLDHHVVSSSPVIPWNDRTLTYVNAGMNQFKPVFLGEAERPCARAASSQKCVRVGGKHNDLADVGTDTYHHTFFEMMGSWSFGDYFKEEACRMAWRLLTEVYQLPPSSLYVTYFKGDEELGLEADLEVKHIWRGIGVPEERILPFGMKDNFWEMGMFGPCGPCTEIHYDRLSRPYAGERVNLGVEDLIELWNIVFIQFERLQDSSLRNLGTHFVDTGMGLERITAVLNNKSSNYDTDLFMPIFSAIQRMSGRPVYSGSFSRDNQCLDTAYRVLADHARMVTVCLADGMFPQECYNLNHIIKRSLSIGCKHFGFTRGHGGLGELARVVAETLGQAYPELMTQLPRITTVLEHEEEAFYDTQKDVSRGWKNLVMERPELASVTCYHVPRSVEGIEDMLPHLPKWRERGNTLPGDAAHKLYATYGFSIALINELAQVYGLVVDEEGLEAAMEEARQRAREGQVRAYYGMGVNKDGRLLEDLQASNIPLTDDSAKYLYNTDSQGRYEFPPVETNILALVVDGSRVERIRGSATVGVILKATNFYHESGGQDGDTGWLETSGAQLRVSSVDNIGGYLIHWGLLEHGEVAVGDTAVVRISEMPRLGCMRNHTATHLLNSVIKTITGVSCQTSSRVTPDYLLLQLHTYQALTPSALTEAHHLIKSWIAQQCPIHRRTIGFQELLQEGSVTLVPGEVYPYSVHVISSRARRDSAIQEGEVGYLESREPCCGTHLLNTAHIGTFVIESVSKAGQSNIRIRGLCGEEAARAESNGVAALQKMREWERLVNEAMSAGAKDRLLHLDQDIKEWHAGMSAKLLPHLVRCSISQAVEDLARLLKKSIRVDANVEMANEVKDIMSRQPAGAIIHLVETDFGTSKPKLRQATKIAKDRPILLMVKTNGIVMARCTLPEAMAGQGASAQEWLSCVQDSLGGCVETPPDKSPRLVANLRSSKLKPCILQEKLQEALESSSKYIGKFSVQAGKSS